MVTPFARAMTLLRAFTPDIEWLGNGELSARTQLPRSTVTRLAQSLVSLGYLHHASDERKYKLAPPALALGYSAVSEQALAPAARALMQTFADQYRLNVNISSRDRLDMIVIASIDGGGAQVPVAVHVGMRMGIGASAIGWALLAVLPHAERQYLVEGLERNAARDWQRHHRKVGEAIAQVHQRGFCGTAAARFEEVGIVAVPLVIEGQAPLVLACVGAKAHMPRPRMDRELGPLLLGLASSIVQEASAR
jgi:DNA-binding IclR family transcriptional regulator